MSTFQTLDTIPPQHIPIKDRALAVIRAVKELGIAIFELLCDMQTEHEMRQRMARLDDRILADIGKTREEVDAVAKRPFWHR